MLLPIISPTNQTRVSTTDLARISRLKRARCAVGSPSTRIINRIELSTPITRRSPKNSTTRNTCGPITKSTSRQLRSVYWKEFEPIIQNGEILYAKCMHCDEYLSGKQSIGTSHLKKHLERCKLRSRVTEFVDKLRAGATPSDIERLGNWIYDSDLAHIALVRMIVLHELPFSIVEYDGFKEFVYSLNPLFKIVSEQL